MIYAFGDGFATGHLWPEWPQILSAIIDQPIHVSGVPGAGNEFIYNCVYDKLRSATADDFFIIQWAPPFRFDKVKQDKAWFDLHASDPTYSRVVPIENDMHWYCTSGSKHHEVLHYADFYIQSDQYNNRSVLYILSTARMLVGLGVEYRFLNTYENKVLGEHPYGQELLALNWVDGLRGQDLWGTTNCPDIAKTQPQPHPYVHYRYVAEVMLPKLNIPYDQSRLEKLGGLILATEFVAYHPDRASQWQDLVASL